MVVRILRLQQVSKEPWKLVGYCCRKTKDILNVIQSLCLCTLWIKIYLVRFWIFETCPETLPYRVEDSHKTFLYPETSGLQNDPWIGFYLQPKVKKRSGVYPLGNNIVRSSKINLLLSALASLAIKKKLRTPHQGLHANSATNRWRCHVKTSTK